MLYFTTRNFSRYDVTGYVNNGEFIYAVGSVGPIIQLHIPVRVLAIFN